MNQRALSRLAATLAALAALAAALAAISQSGGDPAPLANAAWTEAKQGSLDLTLVETPSDSSRQSVEIGAAIGLQPARKAEPSILVSVRDSLGPVEGATVEMIPEGMASHSQLSDAQGHVRISWNAAWKAASIQARKEGRLASRRARFLAPPTKDLDLEIVLRPVATLRVRVEDADGVGLSGAKLRVSRSQSYAADATSDLASLKIENATLDAASAAGEGEIAFEVPSNTRLDLRASHEGFQDATTVVMALLAGETKSLTLSLEKAKLLQVLVKDSTGNPVPGAWVGINDKSRGRSDAQGEARLSLLDERARSILWAYSQGSAVAWEEIGSTELRSAPRILTLLPELRVGGQILGEGGQPLQGIAVTPILGVVLNPHRVPSPTLGSLLRDFQEPTAPAYQVRTDAQGRFLIGGLPAGRLRLSLRPPKGIGAEISDVSAGDENLRIVLPDEEGGNSQGPTIRITAVDAQSSAPLQDASITLWRAQSDSGGSPSKASVESRQRKTDAAGIAEIQFPKTGWFWICASANGYETVESELFYADASFFPKKLVLRRAGSISGKLRQSSGEPADGLFYTLVNAQGESVLLEQRNARGGRQASVWFQTDEEGRFRAEGIPVGSYQLRFFQNPGNQDLACYQQQVKVAPGAAQQLDLSLR